MRKLRYVTADVFTPVPFSGNQLAVVFGAEGLPTETLQAITREFNYAETAFVFPAETPGTTRRVRIFTPELELPFAGHPTIGTAHVLVATGELKTPDATDNTDELTVILGENVGAVPVKVSLSNGVPVHACLATAQLPEEREGIVDVNALAATLGLSGEDIVGGDHSPAAVSCGLPFQIVPVKTVDAVVRARLNKDLWQRSLEGSWAQWPMVFAMTDREADSKLPEHVRGCDIRARVFVPGSSVPEDPATGSANAALAGYLAARTPRTGLVRWEVAQGVEMGRPSRLSIEAEKDGGRITAIRVGGSSVIICEGTMSLPLNH